MTSQTYLIDPTLLFQFEIPIEQVKGKPIDGDWDLSDSYSIPHLAEIGFFPKAPHENNTFADFRMGWGEAGIYLDVRIANQAKIDKETWDENEVNLHFWIDTRGSHGVHRGNMYCHQFDFFAAAGSSSKESSHVRFGPTDRKVDLVKTPYLPNARQVPTPVASSAIFFRSFRTPQERRFRVGIPASAMTGYSPLETSQIGFFYAVHDPLSGAQSLSLSSSVRYYEDPSYWLRGRCQ